LRLGNGDGRRRLRLSNGKRGLCLWRRDGEFRQGIGARCCQPESHAGNDDDERLAVAVHCDIPFAPTGRRLKLALVTGVYPLSPGSFRLFC
jgi:hypothetical protein